MKSIKNGGKMNKMSKQITKQNRTKKMDMRTLTAIGMLSAISFVLMLLDFPVPLMPTFIKMDLSDLPALIGGLAFGPLAGMLIALIKNLLHLPMSQTAWVGEASNFILSSFFVVTAAVFYKKKKTKNMAIIGSVVGAIAMAFASIVSNYFVIYPIYSNFMPIDQIIAAYQAIMPSVGDGTNPLLECLVIFNAPFTFVKGIFSVVITMFIYKPLSPILHGRR